MRYVETEADWLACEEPRGLWIGARDRVDTQRFRRLAAAWCARVRHLFDAEDVLWVDAFTAWAAGAGEPPHRVCQLPDSYPMERGTLLSINIDFCVRAINNDDPMQVALCAAEAVAWGGDQHSVGVDEWAACSAPVRREFCAQFRDVAGNPFRPVAPDPRWLTSTAVGLAQAIDAGARYDRLPILADALEEAGCEAGELLAHCRGAGPHVPGCWAVDLLLGDVLLLRPVG